MIGSGLTKLAKENGMKIAKGVAYGALHGYATTLSEGSGYKQLTITTRFADPVDLGNFHNEIQQRDLTKEFRIRTLNCTEKAIVVVFNDTIGTMDKIRAFVDWFYPFLEEHHASDANTCVECGAQITQGKWILINGIAYHVHESCAVRIKGQIDNANETKKQEDTGSYAGGAVGALIGAVLGAVVWAVVLMMGYVASLVGLLIGWLAEKGYNLLHGKQGKAKVAILIIAVIVGVVLGTLGGYALSFARLISEGETNLTYADIPLLMTVLVTDESTRMNVLMSVGQGMLFAALGVFGIVAQANKETSDVKVIDLE